MAVTTKATRHIVVKPDFQNGCIPIAKVKFDSKEAPENWNYERDEIQISFL